MKCNRTQEECRDPQACLAGGCVGALPGVLAGSGIGSAINGGLPPLDTKLQEAANSIRARIKTLKQAHATELEYVAHRLRERDWHGLWDGAIGAAEWEIERDALLWCLEQMGCEP